MSSRNRGIAGQSLFRVTGRSLILIGVCAFHVIIAPFLDAKNHVFAVLAGVTLVQLIHALSRVDCIACLRSYLPLCGNRTEWWSNQALGPAACMEARPTSWSLSPDCVHSAIEGWPHLYRNLQKPSLPQTHLLINRFSLFIFHCKLDLGAPHESKPALPLHPQVPPEPSHHQHLPEPPQNLQNVLPTQTNKAKREASELRPPPTQHQWSSRLCSDRLGSLDHAILQQGSCVLGRREEDLPFDGVTTSKRVYFGNPSQKSLSAVFESPG